MRNKSAAREEEDTFKDEFLILAASVRPAAVRKSALRLVMSPWQHSDFTEVRGPTPTAESASRGRL